MMTNFTPLPRNLQTVADLLNHLGGVPPERVRWQPLPGLATEQDALTYHPQKRWMELVDGVLVEKTRSFRESFLSCVVIEAMRTFLRQNPLGTVIGEGSVLRLGNGIVRIPDVAYISRDKLPNRMLRATPLPFTIPDLTVDILGPSNTRLELRRKGQDYFAAGVQMVWIIDPVSSVVEVMTSPTNSIQVPRDKALSGGTVLPGFILPLRSLFVEINSTFGGTPK
jgi:Uma2 family endonuclease